MNFIIQSTKAKSSLKSDQVSGHYQLCPKTNSGKLYTIDKHHPAVIAG